MSISLLFLVWVRVAIQIKAHESYFNAILLYNALIRGSNFEVCDTSSV